MGVEDCFCESWIAAATAILAATSRVTVGIGLLRNIALTAMEIVTMARLFPGRLIRSRAVSLAGELADGLIIPGESAWMTCAPLRRPR
jgi:hypothetical protein